MTKKKIKRSTRTGKPAKKTARKRAAPTVRQPRPYVAPKTAVELGYFCKGGNSGEECGAVPVWFDYQLGEIEHLRGFVCDAHKVSNRLEKLGQPGREAA